MSKVKLLISTSLLGIFCLLHFSFKEIAYTASGIKIDSLRGLYERPVMQWPKPNVDSGVKWQEFKPLPDVDSKTYFATMDKPEVVLGKVLFFDPILSGSNQISCSSCHNPQTSWADKLNVPVGNDHGIGDRNAPSLLNVKERKTFFWDGRATTLEEQVSSPISAHNEMAMNLKALPKKLNKNKGYKSPYLSLGNKAWYQNKLTY